MHPARTALRSKAYFFEVLAMLSDYLNVDPDRLIMGGASQGGYSTTVLGEQLLDTLDAFVILCAGRSYGSALPPPAGLIAGHPIFIGAGTNDDPHYQRAQDAAVFYQGLGADVTTEWWPGLGHTVDTDSALLKAWLEGL